MEKNLGLLLWCPHSHHPGCAQPDVPRLGQGALDTPLCWVETPHIHCTVSQAENITQTISSNFGTHRAAKHPLPLHPPLVPPMPIAPTSPIPTHDVTVEGDTVGVEELDNSQEDLRLHIAQDEGALGWDAAGGVLAAHWRLAEHPAERLTAARQHTAVRKHLLLLPAHHKHHITVGERGP